MVLYSGTELRLTLWGQRAAEFNIDNIYDANNPKPIVALFVGCLMKTLMGKIWFRIHSNPCFPMS